MDLSTEGEKEERKEEAGVLLVGKGEGADEEERAEEAEELIVGYVVVFGLLLDT